MYLVLPELMDGKKGTDIVSGHMDELELFQDRRDADLYAHQQNTRFPRSIHKYQVIEMEVQ